VALSEQACGSLVTAAPPTEEPGFEYRSDFSTTCFHTRMLLRHAVICCCGAGAGATGSGSGSGSGGSCCCCCCCCSCCGCSLRAGGGSQQNQGRLSAGLKPRTSAAPCKARGEVNTHTPQHTPTTTHTYHGMHPLSAGTGLGSCLGLGLSCFRMHLPLVRRGWGDGKYLYHSEAVVGGGKGCLKGLSSAQECPLYTRLGRCCRVFTCSP
jgi:hypothetical protein